MEYGPATERRNAPARARAGGVSRILPLLIALCCAALAVSQVGPPSAVPADAPPTVFSSGRALATVREIAQTPHPLGSVEDSRVRQYIVQQLSELGLSPQVQTTVVSQSELVGLLGPRFGGGPLNFPPVNNIIARLKGTSSSKALMLVAHYDSVPFGPGASDDAASVAALIETARALRAAPPLRDDVIFLFTDGEEAGLLGAAGFVQQRNLVGQVGLVLNFEARGSGGPSLMFETSDQNGQLIAQFAQAAPHPIATSLMYDIYRILPNNTDFSVFKAVGLEGFNFAFIDKSQNYHSANDTVGQMDERSLQHQGEYALALARYFGAQDLPPARTSNVVYFDLLGQAFIYYPVGWTIPLAALAALGLLAVLAVGVRGRRLTIGGVALGALAFLASALAVIAALAGAWLAARAIVPRDPALATSGALAALLAALAVVVMLGIYALLARRIAMENLGLGALVWWLILAIATSIYLPGGSYLFALPLLFSLLGLGLIAGGAASPRSLGGALVLALCALPGMVLFVPTIALLFTTLTLRLAWALALLIALALGLLIPHLCLLAAPAARE